MSTQPEAANRLLQTGDQFHVLGQAVLLRLSRAYDGTKIVEAGSTLVLTRDMVELAAEAGGEPWTALIADPTAQVERWGRVKFAPGPATAPGWTYGDPKWEAQRRAALEVVWAITEPVGRAKALAEVQARFARGQGQEAFGDE